MKNIKYFDTMMYNSCRIIKETGEKLNGIYNFPEINSTLSFKDGKYHNENGPAIIKKNIQAYYINDKLHRIDGPARVFLNGKDHWWINGYYIDNETINNFLIENDIPLDYKTWTDSDKMLFALHWSDYNG